MIKKYKLQFLFIPLFYLLLFYVIYQTRKNFFKINVNDAELIWSAKLLPIVLKSEANKILFLVFTLSSLVVNIFYSKILFRILSAFFVITYFSFYFSIGKIFHSYHPFLFSVIILVFYNPKLPIDSIRNNFLIKLIQTICLLSYFNSGLWKIRNLLYTKDSILEIAVRPIAFSIAESGQAPNIIMNKALEFPIFIAFGFITVLLFQLSTIIPIILNKHKKLYGVLIITFHITTGLSLGIWFKGTIYCVFLLFIIAELMSADRKINCLSKVT